jgi:DNA-binding CsgD family transcriptional regulator
VSKSKEFFVIAVLLLVIVFNALDLFDDFSSGESIWHIVEELTMIFLSLGLISVLIVSLKKQHFAIRRLADELHESQQGLAQADQRMQLARQEYSKIIQQQFNVWQLSQSEQEIAFLLLKGLSFNEIAGLRETKEKTVRQQASEIYRKSGVNGRHAFSAWFFEDFLN